MTPAAGRAGPDSRQPPACVPLPRCWLPAAAKPGAAGGGLCHHALGASAALQREGGRPSSARPRRGLPTDSALHCSQGPHLGPAPVPSRPSPSQAGFTDREMMPALDAACYQLGASPGLGTSECGPVSVGLPPALSLAGGESRPLPWSCPLPPETRPRPPGTWLHSSRAHPQGNIYINDFARLVSSDQEAVNGVLHFIDRILLPPEVLHWEADAAPAPRVGPDCGPGTLPPLLTSLLTEPLSPEKLHRCCRGLRLQDLQWPCDGTGPV